MATWDDKPADGADSSDAVSAQSLEAAEAVANRVGIMLRVRWVAAGMAALLVFTRSYPETASWVAGAGLGLAGALAAVNVALWWAYRRLRCRTRAVTALGLIGLVVDTAIAAGYVWVHTFDHTSALWSVLLVPPLEGAVLANLAGAMWTWGAVTAAYAGRDLWGSRAYAYEFSWNSVGFRMGVGFLIAFVVGSLARSLDRDREHLRSALTRLERTDGLRRRLIATLGHDVRTPLGIIRGTLQTLRAGTASPEISAELLAMADRQAERLQRLATGLLDLARLEQGHLSLDIRDLPLRTALESAVAFVDSQGRISVQVDPDTRVHADPDRFEQVVVNLAGNMLSHGAPSFEVRATASEDGVRVEFWDHGPGPAGGDPFEAFHEGGSATSVGYGLTVVEALVRAHEGNVSHRRDRGRTCFAFTLPWRASAPQPSDEVTGRRFAQVEAPDLLGGR